MSESREHLEKIMELMGEGSIRRILLVVLAFLAVSGVVLHGLAGWYILQAGREKWAGTAIQVWPLALGVWILIVGLLLAILRRRLKGMSERGSGEVKPGST